MLSSTAHAQGEAARPQQPDIARPKVLRPAATNASLQSINDDYARQLLDLERLRLQRLGQLAGRQSPREAVETYTELFHLAVANNLFREAESAAHEVLKAPSPMPPDIVFLARTIDIVASADRGEYDESLADLRPPSMPGQKRSEPENPLACYSTRHHSLRSATPIASDCCWETSSTWRAGPSRCC